MVLIFIRHGKDRESSHKHDEKLRKSGKKKAYKLAKKLIKEYGIPDIIYYSPYARTRQTLKSMFKAIKKYKKKYNLTGKPSLINEPKLGRLFTGKERKNPDIRESTLSKGAIITESKEEFRNRIEFHLNEVITKMEQNNSKIWNITHSLVLVHIAKIRNIELPEHLDYLEKIVIE